MFNTYPHYVKMNYNFFKYMILEGNKSNTKIYIFLGTHHFMILRCSLLPLFYKKKKQY